MVEVGGVADGVVDKTPKRNNCQGYGRGGDDNVFRLLLIRDRRYRRWRTR